MEIDNRDRGFALIFVVLVVLVVVVGVVFFVSNSYLGGNEVGKLIGRQPVATNSAVGESEVSDSNDLEVLDQELEQTQVDFPSGEFEQMESSASSL